MKSYHSRHAIIGKRFGALTVIDVDITTHPDLRFGTHMGASRVWVKCQKCGGTSVITRIMLRKSPDCCSYCSGYYWPAEHGKLNRKITVENIAMVMEAMTPDERGRALTLDKAAYVIGVTRNALVAALARAKNRGFSALRQTEA